MFFKKKKEKERKLQKIENIQEILIVDDATINIYILEKFLKKINNNFNIDTARNGKDGIEKCLSKDYDLVFMDIKMPIMNGDEACKEILKTKPNYFIVGVSGQAEKRNIKEYYKSGMKYFLMKPINLKEIENFINTIKT